MDDLSPDVGLVARDVCDHIQGRVLSPVVDAEFLAWGSELTRGVCNRLRSRVVDGKVTGSFAAKEKFHYAGGYLQLTSPEGTREKLWFVVTPAGGDFNVPGASASLQMTSVYEDPPTPRARERLLEAGLVESKDKQSYRLLRAALPLDELNQSVSLEDQITVATEWAEELLCAAGFIRVDASAG